MTTYLLVGVADDWVATAERGLPDLPGIESATVHGPEGSCCCKNCPWDGDHRTPQERAAAGRARHGAARPMGGNGGDAAEARSGDFQLHEGQGYA